MTLSVGVVVTLVLLLVVATITDVRSQKIYNWNTYPGIVSGFLLRWLEEGTAGLEDAGKGFAACGILMLICFVLFGLGGGDLKLAAMMGAFLGFERGVESLLWMLVLGGVLGSVMVVWKLGFLNIVTGTLQHFGKMWRARGWVPLDPQARQPLQQTMFLAPAGLLGVLIVTADVWRPVISR